MDFWLRVCEYRTSSPEVRFGGQTRVTVNSFITHSLIPITVTNDVRHYEVRSLPAPWELTSGLSTRCVLPLIRTDTYLQWKHIRLHQKQDISSRLSVHSSQSCQMPLVHIFTPNAWQVKWTCNTFPSLEGLRSAFEMECFAGSNLWVC